MATEYKLIPDIKPGEFGWTVKAVVSEKCSPNKARNSPLKYQHIWLMDPKGNKVQATLFDNAITAFEDTLLPQKTYLISNAQVKETDKNYAAQLGNIRWTINAKTKIVEINEQFNSLLSSAYTFISFQNLQLYMDTKTEIDIIGIAIDIFPKRVIQVHDNQSTVQDVILINERFETRILQMWDNFVSNECHTVCNTITKKPVLVGSRLKVTSFNGISVSTKLNSSVLINPPFEQVLQLKNWLETNITTVNEIVARKDYIFPTSATISCPPQQKLLNIRQIQQLQHMQKHFWTKANVTLVPLNQPLWYLSCDNCNKSASASVNETYFCRFCKHNYATPTPRARATVELQDSTGSITASIIGNPAETFFKCPAKELMKQTAQEPMENKSKIQTATTQEHILYIKSVNVEAATNKAPYEVIFILDSQLQHQMATNMIQKTTSQTSQPPNANTTPSSSTMETSFTEEADKHPTKKQKQE